MGQEKKSLLSWGLMCLVLLNGCAASKPSAREGWGRAALVTTAIVLASMAPQANVPATATGTFLGDLPPCYPGCRPGFACNAEASTCERLPCDGKCRADQVCDKTGVFEVCVGPWPAPVTPGRVTPE